MSIVCNELLGRDLIKIYQDTDYFNFSLDSMLLAAFPKMTKKIKEYVIYVAVTHQYPFICL